MKFETFDETVEIEQTDTYDEIQIDDKSPRQRFYIVTEFDGIDAKEPSDCRWVQKQINEGNFYLTEDEAKKANTNSHNIFEVHTVEQFRVLCDGEICVNESSNWESSYENAEISVESLKKIGYDESGEAEWKIESVRVIAEIQEVY